MRSRSNSPWILALAALLVRLAAVVLLGSAEAARGATPWEWGAEEATVADALVRGDGLADPWGHGTGATAWLTPVFPALLAGLFALFGGVGVAAAWALFALQSAVDALTCVALARMGCRLGVPRAGRLAALVWALSPLAIWNAAQTVWDTTLVAAALTWFVERWLAYRHDPRFGVAALLGLGYGALLWLNPAPLGLAPVLGLAWLVPRRGGAVRDGAVRAALFFAVAGLVVLPWAWRNARELGTWQLRSNLGVELRLGNHPAAHGHPEPLKYHPSHVPAELALYRELGEVAYAADSKRRALDWIRADPLGFAQLTLWRIELFWVGRAPPWDPRTSAGAGAASDPKSWLKWLVFAALGAGALIAVLRKRSSLALAERAFLGALVLTFGGPYYLTHVSERYRFPIDPVLVLLVATLAVDLWTRNSARTEGPGAGME